MSHAEQIAALVDGYVDSQVAAARDAGEQVAAALRAVVADRDTIITAQAATISEQAARVAELEAAAAGKRTRFGLNLSNGTNAWTGAAKESPADMLARYLQAYGALPVAKVFYPGGLPSTFNTAYEGLVTGKRAYVCFKGWAPTLVAAGAADEKIKSYAASIPAGWDVRLVYWQEPDAKMWVSNEFTAAQYRAACDRIGDIVHAARPAGHVELWACFMGYSVKPRSTDVDRFDQACISDRLDGIGWDYYWNTPEDSWDSASIPTVLAKMVDVAKTAGVPRVALLETGDRPHANDTNGNGRAAFWSKVFDEAVRLGYEDVCWFDLVGTTGDHRIIPGQPFSDALAAVLRARIGG